MSKTNLVMYTTNPLMASGGPTKEKSKKDEEKFKDKEHKEHKDHKDEEKKTFRGPFSRRPWKTDKKKGKSEISPGDAQILLETFEEKLFICNPAGIVLLSTLGNKAKGIPVEEAISSIHAVPNSYAVTLRRCIQLVLQSCQKIWFQTPLLDYDQQHSSSSANISSEMTTSIKPFRKLAGSDGPSSVAITIAFSEYQMNAPIALDKSPFTIDGSLSEVDYSPPNEPTYLFSLDGVFRSIAKTTAETFQMRYGWVSRIVETAPWRIKIVALWDDKKQEFYSNCLEFDLEGSFWGLVGQSDGPVCYASNAKSLFPTDLVIAQFGIESLVFSNAKIGTDNSTFMWIGAMHTSPTLWQQSTLKALLSALTLRAEDQLSKLKKQHHYWMSDQVLKQMSDAVIILDTMGKVVQWKGTAEQVFGMKTDEVRGTTTEGLFAHTESYAEFNDWLLKATSRIGKFDPEKDYLKREIMCRKRDGSFFDGEMSAKVVRLDLPILVLVVVRDITERIRTHQELRTLCALLEKSRDDALAGIRMKSLFLANVSHEIRTPMNAIIGMTQLLLDTTLSPHQSQLVDDIRISGDHLIAIINDILDISKLEAGKVVLDRLPISILKCIEDAYRLTSRSFPNSQVKFEYLIAPGVPESILGDPTRMTQILINLLSNAMKFTQKGFILVSVCLATPTNIPVGGTTVIATPQFSQLALSSSAAGISATTFGGVNDEETIELLFMIRDSGIGIPQEALIRIFEPFEQSDTASTRKYGGTGLGLSICARLVQCMGGKIWAESEKDRGSAFSFTILAKKAREGDVHSTEVRGSLNLYLVHQQKSPSPSTLSPRMNSSQIKQELNGRALSPSASPTHLYGIHASLSPNPGPTPASTPSPTPTSTPTPSASPSPVEPPITALVPEPTPTKKSLVQVTVPRSSNIPPPIKEHASLSILVAEDNLMNQKVILMLLSKIGCEADLACNGVEAVNAAEKKHYDLILMDVQMPEMDGIEATSRISRMKPHPDHFPPVIIALTANVCEQDQIIRYHNAGMVHILAKPVKLTLLQDVMSQLPSYREIIREREEKKKP